MKTAGISIIWFHVIFAHKWWQQFKEISTLCINAFYLHIFLAGYLPNIRYDCLDEQNKGLTGLWHKAAKIEKRQDTLFESETSFFIFQKRCQKESHSSSFGTVTSIQMYLRIVPRLLLFPKHKEAKDVIDCVLRTRNAIVNYRTNFTTCLISIFSVSSAS